MSQLAGSDSPYQIGGPAGDTALRPHADKCQDVATDLIYIRKDWRERTLNQRRKELAAKDR